MYLSPCGPTSRALEAAEELWFRVPAPDSGSECQPRTLVQSASPGLWFRVPAPDSGSGCQPRTLVQGASPGLWFRVPAPDFSPGERGFNPACMSCRAITGFSPGVNAFRCPSAPLPPGLKPSICCRGGGFKNPPPRTKSPGLAPTRVNDLASTYRALSPCHTSLTDTRR
jgi:hypothetical protein